jgi:methionyl-tRNA formyltransferase
VSLSKSLKQKIVFMGTPSFAAAALDALAGTGYDVLLAVSQPDKPKGRGNKVLPPPVKARALELGIDVAQPLTVKNNEEFVKMLEKLSPDLIVVAAYGKVLPLSVLEIPRFGCVNIHASLLPEYRGAAPVQRAILDGKAESGVTLMRMEEGLDEGAVFAQANVPIEGLDSGEVTDLLAKRGSELLIEKLPEILDGSIQAVPQDDASASYAPMIQKSDGHLTFGGSAQACRRTVLAMNPSPGAFAYLGDVQMKVRRVAIAAEAGAVGTDATPGAVIGVSESGIHVACREGVLVIETLQLPGKNPVRVADYLRGNKIELGTVLR